MDVERKAITSASPMVTVIIPNFNHAKYLPKRIDSVLGQTYQNIEVIILDDCSTDNSRDVIEHYRSEEKVKKIIFNERNTGNTFLQWDKGIEAASGDYVWIAESDDVAEPEFVSTMIDELEHHPNAVLAYSYSKVIDQDDVVLYNDASLSQSDQRVKLHRGVEYMRRYMLRDNCIYNASMVVFRRPIFGQINPCYKRHRYCGDWFFWAFACTLGDVIEVRVPLSQFRQHANKVTVKAQRSAAAMQDASTMMQQLVEILHLRKYYRSAMRVIWTRRMKGLQQSEQKEAIIASCPVLYRTRWYDYILYKYAKNFGFLKYRVHNVMNIFNVPNP